MHTNGDPREDGEPPLDESPQPTHRPDERTRVAEEREPIAEEREHIAEEREELPTSARRWSDGASAVPRSRGAHPPLGGTGTAADRRERLADERERRPPPEHSGLASVALGIVRRDDRRGGVKWRR